MTIRDVAKLANVGIATVSRVINGHGSVSEKTRERVLEAIATLDYIPNAAAQNLSSGQTMLIGVIVPYFTRPIYVQRVIGIQRVLDDTDYDVVLLSTRSPEKTYQQLSQMIGQQRFDAAILISISVPESIRLRLAKYNVPVVLVEAYNDYMSCVSIDNRFGGQLATEYLLSLGHTRIAFVGDQRFNPFGFSAANERYIGYQYALSEAGINVNPAYTSFAPLSEHGKATAVEQAMALLKLPVPPTAIFATSDTQAFGILEAARQLGIAVPEELSVIGFDDIEAAHYLNLSTVRQPAIKSGMLAAQFLLDHLADANLGRQEEWLDLEVIERGSTAPYQGKIGGRHAL